jgi:hypothetical protein
MATTTKTRAIDVQKVLSGAVKLEVKLLNAGVESVQVYLNQATRFSALAAETLQAVQDDKATLADTALKFSDFGRQSLQAYTELSQRLGKSYYDEVDRLVDSALKNNKTENAEDTGSGGKVDSVDKVETRPPVKVTAVKRAARRR